MITNSGAAVWIPWDDYGGVALGAHLYDATGALVNFDVHCEPLTTPVREVGPGETVRLRVAYPALAVGRYVLELDCVASGVTWFAQAGSAPVRLPVDVVAANG